MIEMRTLLLMDKNLRSYRGFFERRYLMRIPARSPHTVSIIRQIPDGGINEIESGLRYVSAREANDTRAECFGT